MKLRILGAALAVVLALGGTLVLVNYVNTADARAAQGAKLVPAYFVDSEVPAGTAGAAIADFLIVKQIPAAAAAPERVTDLADLEGLVSSVALAPGEQLIPARWVDPSTAAGAGTFAVPDGMQAVALALPVERVVGGAIEAGDTVGVVISAESGDSAGGSDIRRTTQTFHKVPVLSVQRGTALPGSDATGASDDSVETVMVTLAQRTQDIEVLVWGQQWGTVWLTLEPENADAEGGRTVDGEVVFR